MVISAHGVYQGARESDPEDSEGEAAVSQARATVAKLASAAKAGIIDVARTSEVLAVSRRNAALKMAALARRGWLLRARRGLYLILPLEAEPGRPMVAEDPWVLASEAFSPCYIGGWSAAEHWGLTEQIFRSTLVVTAASVRSRSVRLLDHEFRLFRVPRGRVQGAVSVWRGAERVPVSDRERTIVDCLRHPELCGGIGLLALIMGEYANDKERDFAKLTAVAEQFGGGAAWKRLGYLSEVLWPEAMGVVEKAQAHTTAGNVKLDPAVRKRGKLLRRWHLWINTPVDAEAPDA